MTDIIDSIFEQMNKWASLNGKKEIKFVTVIGLTIEGEAIFGTRGQASEDELFHLFRLARKKQVEIALFQVIIN